MSKNILRWFVQVSMTAVEMVVFHRDKFCFVFCWLFCLYVFTFQLLVVVVPVLSTPAPNSNAGTAQGQEFGC